jgi:hypothetical protein
VKRKGKEEGLSCVIMEVVMGIREGRVRIFFT